MALTYKDAGVDIDAGDRLVDRIGPLAKKTRIPEVLGDVGGFAGLCGLPAGLKEPILVSGTDGVGTKLKIAFQTGVHDTIGFDLVGMCVNDVLTCGARPLFFLDYFGTGRLDVGVAESVIRGIADACLASGCALLGGETAELPGMYADGEYDLAGFVVGVVEKARIVDGKRVSPGDVALALPSSGLHSNGYSLARRAVEAAGLALTDKPDELLGQTVAEALLTPTKLYAKCILPLVAEASDVDVRAMAHITGGGLPGNVPRVLPHGLGLKLTSSWKRPPIIDLIARRGPVAEEELRRTFNLGVGYVVVVPMGDAARATQFLREQGEAPFVLGEICSVEADTEFEARVIF